jgi:hypothetical protein
MTSALQAGSQSNQPKPLFVVVLQILQDEDDFAGLDESELLAGQRLDGLGIFIQPPHFFTQRRVLMANLLE